MKTEETTVKVVSEEAANNVEVEKTDEKKSKENESLTENIISKVSIAGKEEVLDIIQKKADIIAVEEVPNIIEEKVENTATKVVESYGISGSAASQTRSRDSLCYSSDKPF